MPAWVYILRLQSGGLYIGSTENLERRYSEHLEGNGSRTTRLDPPMALVYREELDDCAKAPAREMQLKRWTRAKKEVLITGAIKRLKALSRCHVTKNKV
ncbi:MAG: GIY-YIG nuclease family protein [Planctomycetes bacterium]|nr:GIY-YIG nuclease family protein [Planctomycetota bacterium]